MENSVKPCLFHSLHWNSWFWGAEESWQIQTVPSEYLLFMCELCCAAESWRRRLNEISVQLEAGTVHVPPCFPKVKASLEVRSSRVLQPHCHESLMCLSSPLLIRLIKISLIHLTTHPHLPPTNTYSPTHPPHPPSTRYYSRLHMHAAFVIELPVQCLSLGDLLAVWMFLKLAVKWKTGWWQVGAPEKAFFFWL